MESEGPDDKTIVLYYVVDKRGTVHHIADNKRQAEDNLETNKGRMKGSVVKSVEVPLEDWENDKIKEFNLINYIRKKK